MSSDSEVDRLEMKRSKLYQELSGIGDFRRGSITINYRRCGKPNCICAKPDHPGHGPQYRLTTKLGGKTQARNLKPGPELQIVEQEVDNHQRFRKLLNSIVEVNEKICDSREMEFLNDPEAEADATAKKGASKTGSKRKS